MKNLFSRLQDFESRPNQKKFRTFVEHQLKIAEADNEGTRYYPPRLLLAIKGSVNLQKYLSAEQKDRLNNVLDSEKKEVQNKVLKLDPSQWTVQQTLHATGVYETLKKKKGNLKSEEKTLFKSLSKKIIEKGVSILATYRLTSVTGLEGKVFQSYAERLLLLELYRVNPNENDWQTKYEGEIKNLDDGTRGVETKKFGEVLRELSANVSTEIVKETGEHNRETVLYWETIDELRESGLENIDINLDDEKVKDLQDNIKRVNVAQFLLWARGQKELLPAQYKLLKKLENEEIKFKNKEFGKFKEDEDPNAYSSVMVKLENLEKELKSVNKDLDEVKGKEIEEVLKLMEADDSDFSSATKKKLKESKESYLKSVKAKNDIKGDGNLLGVLPDNLFEDFENNEFSTFKGDFKDEFEFVDKSENLDKSTFSDRLKNLQEVISFYQKGCENKRNKLVQDLGLITDTSTQEYIDTKDALDKLDLLIDKFGGFVDGPSGISKKLSKLDDIYRKFDINKNAFINDIRSWVGDEDRKDAGLKNQIDSLKDKKDKLEAQKNAITLENQDEEIFLDYLDDPKQFAGEHKKSFERLLEVRGRQNNILSSDLLLYYDDEDLAKRSLDTEEVKKWDKIKAFREEKIDPLLENLDIDHLKPYEEFEAVILDDISAFEEAFGKEQSPKEIIDGMVLYYREQILKKIRDENLFVSENFYDDMHKRLRVHGTARDSFEIEKIEADAQKYVNDQGYERSIVETENHNYEATMSRIENEDVKKDLQDVFEHKKDVLVKGQTLDNGDYIPGMDALRTMDVKTADIFRELNETQSAIGGKLSQLQAKLVDLEKSDDLDDKNEITRKEIQAEIKDVIAQWRQETYEKLKRQINSFEKVCRNVLGENFKQNFVDFFERARRELDSINDDFNDFFNKYFVGSSVGNIDAFEHLLKGTPNQLAELAKLLRFDGGDWQDKQKEVGESFMNSAEAVDNLDKFGFFDQEGAESDGYNYEKARKNFEEDRENFSKKYNEYTDSTKRIVRKVNKDITWLDDEDFMKKYGFDKEYAKQKIIPELNSANGEFDDIWKKFHGKDNNYWDEFEKDWKSGDPAKRAKAMEGVENWKSVAKHTEDMAKKNKEYEGWLKDYEEKSSIWHRKGFRCFDPNGVEVQWFSLLSIYETVKQVLDARDRKLKRDTDKMVGTLGTKLFGTKGTVGKEFYRLLNKSESERISEYKEGYDR